MNRKTVIYLACAVGATGVTYWYVRKQLQSLLHLAVEDTSGQEEIEDLLDEVAVQGFLTRHPVRDQADG